MQNNNRHPTSNPEHTPVYDIVGIGVGPFNLGLAALIEPLVHTQEISAALFDEREEFRWHPGVMFDDATIQVPFIADLVTFADPCSKFSFLSYLKKSNRLYQFYIRESFYPFRSEYSDYCAWVAAQLDYIHWNSKVQSVTRAETGVWEVSFGAESNNKVYARNIVNGTGTSPYVPDSLIPSQQGRGSVFHSSEFLSHTSDLEAANSITIVGSGQSAAEIYRFLLESCAGNGIELNWYTRSPRFFPMEYTALTLEMTSPDYARYFRSLPPGTRDSLNRKQRSLYKGISSSLIDEVYDKLYKVSLSQPWKGELRAGVEVGLEATTGTNHEHLLTLTDTLTGKTETRRTELLILATGYSHSKVPDHLNMIDEINRDESGRMRVSERFAVNDKQDLFVLNTEEHVHSLIAPDLGMGPWRNSIIINTIFGRDIYPVETSIAFQSFGVSDT